MVLKIFAVPVAPRTVVFCFRDMFINKKVHVRPWREGSTTGEKARLFATGMVEKVKAEMQELEHADPGLSGLSVSRIDLD
jgi:hypothetical protein